MRFKNAGFGLRMGACACVLLLGCLSCDGSDSATLGPTSNPGDAAILEVTPVNATIPLAGQTVKLDVSVRTGRGRQATNALVLWETSAPNIAMVNADGTVTGLDVGSAEIRARMGNLSATAVVTVVDKPYAQTADRLRIEPNGDTIPQVGGATTLKAVAYDIRNRSFSAPAGVSWFSLDPQVASVADGKITARGKGAARILITNGSLADTAVVWVQPTSPVVRVSITAEEDTVYALGESVRLHASALDGSGQPIPGEVLTLAVLDPTVATIDDESNVVAMGSGVARITANYGKTSDTTTLAVSLSGGSSVTLSPKVDTIPAVGGTTTLRATVVGNAKLKWQSLDPYATVTDDAGTVLGLRQGVARIVAKASSSADTAVVWIAPAAPSAKAHSVVVQPAADTITVIGGTVQLSSLVLDSNDSPIQDQTVSWSTPNPGRVQVSGSGKVTALAQGVALVIATAAGTVVSDTATIWVEPVPAVMDIKINPGTDTIPTVGSSITLDAEAVDANGNVLSSANAVWQSLDPAVAQVAATGTTSPTMLVTGKSRGMARIVATQQSMVDTALVMVEDAVTPQATRVRVTPKTDTINAGSSVQLTGSVLDQNGNVMNGLAVAWQPLDPAVASVSGSGLVSGLGSGVARVRAYYGTLADTARIWVTTTSSNPKPGTYQIPASIDASGTRDVTDDLLAFFATVPDGSTVVFPAGAKYRSEGTLAVVDRNDITFEGNGATILQTTDGSGTIPLTGTGWVSNWPRNRSIWATLRGSNIRWRNFVLRGGNPSAGQADDAFVVALEAQHGFDIGSTEGVEITNVRLTDIWGDFVYLGLAYKSSDWPKDVYIHDNHFERNGRQGIGIANGEDVLFERNYIGEVRRASIDIEPNGTYGGARRITFRNNTFGPGRLTWLASAGKGGIAEDITLENNILVGKAAIIIVRPPEGTRRARFRVVGNVSDQSHGSNQPLMQFYRVDGLTVRNNINPLNPGRDMIGVYASESCTVSVGNNTFVNALREYLVDAFAGCT